MVKRWKIHQKDLSKISSKNSSKNLSKILSKNSLKNSSKNSSRNWSKKLVKKIGQSQKILQGHQSNNEFYLIYISLARPISVLRSFACPAREQQALICIKPREQACGQK